MGSLVRLAGRVKEPLEGASAPPATAAMRGTVAGARLRSDQASVELTIFGLARWRLRLNTDARIYGEDFSDHPSADVTAVPGELHDRPCRAAVTVGPYSVLVFSQDREDSEAAG